MPARRPLLDRVVLVVGASSGMGRAISLELAAAGARIAAAARSADKLEGVAEAARRSGGEVNAFPADATDPAAMRRLVDAVMARHGRLDAVVITVGTNIAERRLDQLTPKSWGDMLDSNLNAAFHVSQAVVPAMRNQGAGLIVYISSSAARKPDQSGAAYQASKAGVLALAHAISEEERSNGIRTSVILPGLTHTDLVYKRPTAPTAEMLANALQPEDVAAAVLFIVGLPPRATVPEMQLFPSR